MGSPGRSRLVAIAHIFWGVGSFKVAIAHIFPWIRHCYCISTLLIILLCLFLSICTVQTVCAFVLYGLRVCYKTFKLKLN